MADRLTDAELEAMRGHTPGEWQFHDGYLVRACTGDWCAPIAELRAPYRPNVGIVRGEHEDQANGRIIASGPLMLAELIKRRAMDAELQSLLIQWRHNAQGCSRHESHAAGTWRSCARDLESFLAKLKESA